MLIGIPEEETKLTEQRTRELYASKWTIDNLTASLMDSSVGSLGLYEDAARAKAAKIVDWLTHIVGIAVPRTHE
jgi:hypothetical protein